MNIEEFHALTRAIITGDLQKIEEFLEQPSNDNVVPYIKLFYFACIFHSPYQQKFLNLFLSYSPTPEVDLDLLGDNSEYFFPDEVSRYNPNIDALSSDSDKLPIIYFLWPSASIELFEKSLKVFGLDGDGDSESLQNYLTSNLNGVPLYHLLTHTSLEKVARLLRHININQLSYEVAMQFYEAADAAENEEITFAFTQVKQITLQRWLNAAVIAGNEEHIDILINLGADLNAPMDTSGTTPFLYACQQNNFELAKSLEFIDVDVTATDAKGNNAIHCLLNGTLKDDGRDLDLDFFEWLLDLKKIDINAVNTRRQTPLHIACNIADRDLAVEILLKHKPAYTADIDGNTPLHHITRCPVECDIEIAALLLDNFPKSILRSTNKEACTPFLSACFELANGAEVDLTALHDMLEFLLSRGADVNHTDIRHGSALHYLATVNDSEGVALLLNTPGIKYAKMIHCAHHGVQHNALDIAIEGTGDQTAKTKTAQLLTQKGMTCRVSSNQLQVQALLKTPIKPSPAPVKFDPAAELTAIKKLILTKNLAATLEKLTTHRREIKIFLQPGSSILVLAAAAGGDFEFVKGLFSHLQKLTNKPHTAYRLLQQSIREALSYLENKTEDNFVAIRHFLTKKLPPAEHHSPTGALIPSNKAPERLSIHRACARGSLEDVATLLKDLDETQQAQLILSRDERGYTALHCACESSNEALISTLLRNKQIKFSACTDPHHANTAKAITPLRLLIANATNIPLIHKLLGQVDWAIEPPYHELKVFTHWKTGDALQKAIMEQTLLQTLLTEECANICNEVLAEHSDAVTTANDLPTAEIEEEAAASTCLPSAAIAASTAKNLAVTPPTRRAPTLVPVQFIVTRPSAISPFTFFVKPLPEVAQIKFPEKAAKLSM